MTRILNCNILDNNNDLFAAAPKPFISEKPGNMIFTKMDEYICYI